MKYAIVTPTFRPHFKYVKKLLESQKKYVLDKNNLKHVFVVSRNEYEEFKEIVKNYSTQFEVKILFTEDLFAWALIDESPEEVLQKYGKFSYQTIKKFLALLYIDEEYSLILDSESMWVREFRIDELFRNYFNNPFVVYSRVDKGLGDGEVKKSVLKNNKIIFQSLENEWFLETFDWFYDKKILKQFLDKKSIYEIVKEVYLKSDDVNKKYGCFEIQLYESFIYLNREKFKYKFINVTELLKSTLGDEFKNYVDLYSFVFKGESGILEQVAVLQNTKGKSLAESMKREGIQIIRCSFSTLENRKYQLSVMKELNPVIMAASQDHCFGLNDDTATKFYFYFLKYNDLARNGYHYLRCFIHPFVLFLNWLAYPIKFVSVGIRWVGVFIKNFKVIV